MGVGGGWGRVNLNWGVISVEMPFEIFPPQKKWSHVNENEKNKKEKEKKKKEHFEKQRQQMFWR